MYKRQIQYGIPAGEIAFIHDAKTDAQRDALFKEMRTGKKKMCIRDRSIAKSKECYVLLRVVRKIPKKKDKCEKPAIDNEFAIELDKDELKLFKGLYAETFK